MTRVSPRPFLATLALAFSAILFLPACSDSAAKGNPSQTPSAPAAPVRIGEVVQKPMPIRMSAVGAVEPFATVMVKSRVSGELTKVWFEEGQEVGQGDTLFSLDARPLEASLRQAKADLARAEAQLKQAQANSVRDTAQARHAREQADRFGRLAGQGAVSRDEFESLRANAEALEASVEANEAAEQSARQAIEGAHASIETMELQLEYATIRSPIAGRTGRLLVHEGNLVRENDAQPLVVINQMEPIYVSFAVPDEHLPALREAMEAARLDVVTTIPGEEARPLEGSLAFLDNTVDRGTGTIRAKALFGNEERRLWPGQFVEVEATLRVIADAIVAPAQAIQTGQDGEYVYVVAADLTVEPRPVVLGVASGGEVVIAEGLASGERVVTEGQLRLSPGSRVEILGVDDPAAAPPPDVMIGDAP